MVRIVPIHPTIGVEIHGLDLSGDLTEDERALVNAALRQWKAVFFREQKIDSDAFVAFASSFGPLLVDDHLPQDGRRATQLAYKQGDDKSPRTDIWHSDRSYASQNIAKFIALRAVALPATGGDTLFADMEKAYAGLSPAMRSMLDDLHCIHDGFPISSPRIPVERWAERKDTMRSAFPIVRAGPSREHALIYVNAAFTTRILELNPDESTVLLNFLFDLPKRPENHCRFRWDEGSIALWDNRRTQHYLSHDFWPEPRVMERCMIAGEWND